MAQISSPYPNNLHDIYGTASVIPAMITNDMWSNANTAQQLNQQQAQQDIDRASQMNPLEIEGKRLMNENQSLQNVFQGYNNTLEGNKAQISNASLNQDVANAPELSKLKLTEAQIKAHSDFGDALSNLGRQWKASGVMPDEIKSMGAQFQNPDQAIAAGDNITRHTKEYMASIDHANIAAAASRYAADQQTKREEMAEKAGKYKNRYNQSISQMLQFITEPKQRLSAISGYLPALKDEIDNTDDRDPNKAVLINKYNVLAKDAINQKKIVESTSPGTYAKPGQAAIGEMGMPVNPNKSIDVPFTNYDGSEIKDNGPQKDSDGHTVVKTKSGKTVIIPNQ